MLKYPQYKLFYLLLSLICTHCTSAQEVKTIKFDELTFEIENSEQEIKLINFWATWCKPCIVEIPVLEQKNKEADVLLVSMDFASQKELVNQFVKRKEIESRVVLLDESDYDSWISKIDSSWSGAIPATLIINTKTKKRIFVEGSLTSEILNEKIAETRQ
ncbi:Thioredoxin [Spirosomataceae bacterium TFI 002]|nr:Thioredoxin [Spirosomataceae bacterium TFI 002]